MASRKREEFLFNLIATGRTSQFDELNDKRHRNGSNQADKAKESEAHVYKCLAGLNYICYVRFVSDTKADKFQKDLEAKIHEVKYLRRFGEKLSIPNNKIWAQVKSCPEYANAFIAGATTVAYGEELTGPDALYYLRILVLNGYSGLADAKIEADIEDQLQKMNTFWKNAR